MSLYETLKAAKLGAAPDVLTKLRAQIAPFAKGGGTSEKELEDTPPLSFKANGEPLIDWSMDGASGGVGDKTNNLFNKAKVTKGYALDADGNAVPTSTFCVSDYINVNSSAEIKLYNVYTSDTAWRLRIHGYNNQEWVEQVYTKNIVSTEPENIVITIPQTVTAIRMSIGYDNRQDLDVLMVSDNQNLSAYEPYGYKISVTCGGETNTFYLDEPLGTSDSISMTSTGVSIPTVNGSNTLSVGTTVQPSSVYIKYKE